MSVVAPAIVETALGQNTPPRRSAATDGNLLPHVVVTPEAVTEAVAAFIRFGWGEVGVLPH